MQDLIIVWKNEWSRLWRRKGFLFLALAWPVLFGVLFGQIYAQRVVQRMPLALVDEDRTQISRTLSRYIETNRSFEVKTTPLDPEAVKDDFLSGSYAAVVIIPRDFQRDIKRGHRTNLTIWVNATNVVVANLVASEMAYVAGTINGGIQLKFLQKAGNSTARAMELIQPFPLNAARLYNPGMNYLNYLAPGIWAAILHQVIILLGALCFVPHFQRQEVKVLLAELKQPWSLFWGKGLFYLVLSIASFEIFFRALFPLFEITIRSSVAEILALSALFSATALSLGFAISLFSTRTVGALKGVLLLASPAFILSGYTFPIDQMPKIYTYISSIFPLTPFVSAYRKIYQEGLSLSYVSHEFWHLTILFVIYLGLACLLYRKRWVRSS